MRKAIVVVLFLPMAIVMQSGMLFVMPIIFIGYWFNKWTLDVTKREFFAPMIMWLDAFEGAARNDRQ